MTMTTDVDSPSQKNYIVWLDIEDRIGEALTNLRDVEALSPSERLQGKIEGVKAAQREAERLKAAGTPYLSLLREWLVHNLMNPTNYEQQKRGYGYRLVLDYTRAY